MIAGSNKKKRGAQGYQLVAGLLTQLLDDSQMKNDRRRCDCNCLKKIQDFNAAWTHDLGIPMWCSTNWAM